MTTLSTHDTKRQEDVRARLDGGGAPRDLDDEKLLVTAQALRLRRERPEWFGAEDAAKAATGAGAART